MLNATILILFEFVMLKSLSFSQQPQRHIWKCGEVVAKYDKIIMLILSILVEIIFKIKIKSVLCHSSPTPAHWHVCAALSAGTLVSVELRLWRTKRRRLASRTLPAAPNPGTFRARTNRRNRTAPRANPRHHRRLTFSRSVSLALSVGRSVCL